MRPTKTGVKKSVTPAVIDEKKDRWQKSFSLLFEVSQAIVSNRYLEEILSLIVKMTAELTNSKICSLMLLDEEKNQLVIKATQSLSEAYKNKPPVKVGESVSGRALKSKKPIYVRDVTREYDYKYPEIARAEGLKSLLCVPMLVQEKVIGVINCYSHGEYNFTQEEIQILTGVANQAAMAIENTRLLVEKINAVEALERRKKLERAKGILMRRQQIGEEDAYRLMQKQSMDARRSLAEIADAIIVSEEMNGFKKK